ncbi:uncharacterized protein LOC127797963 isoform X2 [Diospyros lotus]|uniref:uncharacterized protein LOC127797963 isoform X2 n=1 Tax=Diospyros lotus TaxID=55363 RepID=UPI0022520DC8|nr:uncharacterized protein LOC127797963 isoform X2 [Diospyros lotus]
MACRSSVFRTVFLTELCRPLPRNPPPFAAAVSFISRHKSSICGCKIVAARDFHHARRTTRLPLNCSHNQSPQSSPPEDQDQGPPQEAVLKAISEVSKTEGRVGQTTNVVIGGTVTDDSTNEWLVLDQKVNSYPTIRGFTAIGTGGDDFVQSMVVAVESVLQQPIPEGQVKHKLSSRGKYVSVNIGPVRVVSSEQVQAVYNAMRRDDRMKYFL